MALQCPNSLVAIAGFFAGLSTEKLETLGDIYSPNVMFEDPLHEIKGIPALRDAYATLLQQLEGLKVTVTDAHGDDSTGFLLWSLDYQAGGRRATIQGTSHIEFAPDGRVARQCNHWDSSEPVYGGFPLTRWLMQRIRSRISVSIG